MSMSLIFVSHHVHCNADVLGSLFAVQPCAVMSTKSGLLLRLELREWATAMMIAL